MVKLKPKQYIFRDVGGYQWKNPVNAPKWFAINIVIILDNTD